MDGARLFSRVKRLQLVSTKLVESILAGNYRSVFKGPGLEFDEVREYVLGDEARLIDWNVSSRMASPYTKTFREERELTLFTIVDLSSSIFTGSADVSRRDTVSMLYSLLAFAAVKNNDRIGSVFFTDRIEHWVPPLKGKKHALRTIEDMLTFTPTGTGSDLALALRTVGEALKRRGICVILSDFKTSGYWKDLAILGRRHDVIAVKISDPLDTEYPVSGIVELQDPETGEVTLGAGGSRVFRKRYHEFWERHNRQWLTECRKRGIATLEISTTADPAEKLIMFFNRRRKR
jgi:uncharacterized protein (DUF58 family)